MKELHRVLNMPQYVRIFLNRTCPKCPNMSVFTIIGRVLNMPLNVSRTQGHSTNK